MFTLFCAASSINLLTALQPTVNRVVCRAFVTLQTNATLGPKLSIKGSASAITQDTPIHCRPQLSNAIEVAWSRGTCVLWITAVIVVGVVVIRSISILQCKISQLASKIAKYGKKKEDSHSITMSRNR